VWGSLLPIVGGCSLSAMKEVSFSWGGFNNAMISNLGMVLRNIYSKKSLNDYKVGLELWVAMLGSSFGHDSVRMCVLCALTMGWCGLGRIRGGLIMQQSQYQIKQLVYAVCLELYHTRAACVTRCALSDDEVC
jgi:hypothetical protein